MSRSYLVWALIGLALAGCATTEQRSADRRVVRTASWNKYFVAGSRIPRELDPSGQPLTGSHVVTITDEQLQRSSGVLLGEKLTGGYPR